MEKFASVFSLILLCMILLFSCGISEQTTATTEAIQTLEITSTVTTTSLILQPPENVATTEIDLPEYTPATTSVHVTSSIVSPQTTENITATTTTAPPTIPPPMPNDGKRDELFTKRIATPITYVKSVDSVRYTITLDREEYYIGDDLNIHIIAENLGTEPILVIKKFDADLGDLIRVSVCTSGTPFTEINMGYIGTEATVIEQIDQWMPGETAEILGRQPINAGLATPSLSLLISVDGTHRVEIPLKIHESVPQDCELYPYLENGDITNALYHRALVMNEEETIPIVISKAWDRNQILPGEKIQPLPNSYGYEDNMFLEFDGAIVYLTRVQLIEMLKTQAPLKTASRPPLKYIYETLLVNILSQAYPLKKMN